MGITYLFYNHAAKGVVLLKEPQSLIFDGSLSGENSLDVLNAKKRDKYV